MLLTNAYDPDPRVREEALSLIAGGWTVKLLAWDRDLRKPSQEDVEGVAVERIYLASRHGRGNTQLFYYAWLYLLFFWRAWRTSFDVLHCHDLDTLPLGFVVARLKRKRLVYDAHESFPDMLEGNVHRWVQGGLVRLENFLIRRVDLLITVGEKLRRHFAGRGGKNTVVIGNWKRLGEFARTPAENSALRRSLGIPEQALLVVCVTQLFVDRKLEELLEAVAGSEDVWLILAGKGALESRVREAADGNPRMRYVGFVSGREIAAYTCAADAIYYGFDPANPNARFSAPNKLYEALAAGKPIITGDFGEIADVVREAECGIVLSRYGVSEIRQAFAALRDEAVRSSMSAQAWRLGRQAMNWEKGSEILLREYAGLTAEPAGGSAAVSTGMAVDSRRDTPRRAEHGTKVKV